MRQADREGENAAMARRDRQKLVHKKTGNSGSGEFERPRRVDSTDPAATAWPG